MSWQVYTRGTIYLHRVYFLIIAIADSSKKILGMDNDKIVYINIGSKTYWLCDKKQIDKTGFYILNLISNKTKAKEHFNNIFVWSKKAIAVAEKIRNKQLSKFSNKDLISTYDFIYDQSLEAFATMNPLIDAIDTIFEDFLLDIIFKELGDTKKAKNIYGILSRTDYQSYVNQQEIEIIKLAKQDKITLEDINKLYKKFWWTSLGWESLRINDRKYFSKEINKYRKQGNIDTKLQDLLNINQKIKEDRNKIIKEYRLSDNIKHWLWVLDKYTYFHDLRKEMQVRTMYSLYLIMSETARRLNLNKDDLEWLTIEEVKSLLRGKKFDKQKILSRQEAICVVSKKGFFKLYSGKKAKVEINKYILASKKNINTFKGLGVSKGKIVGRVKVCAGGQDAIKKIKKGDILVCGMTLPDYVPAMKKAKAIITDEGGVTCHAAIVSRELGIPCIVGTKIATQALKDLDQVEVDANKGIVKKIK